MQTLKILSTSYITHDVKRIVLEKPQGFMYRPGQAALLSAKTPGWEDKKKPFTFTSLMDMPFVEFTIKIYKEHNGVTNELDKLKIGDEIILHGIKETFEYKGPGIFIAGGSGITPFIAIFRALYYSNNMRGVALLYSNHTVQDIIYHDELTMMLGAAYKNVFTRQGVIGFKERRLDRDFLLETLSSFDQRFYVCGPKGFVEDISSALLSLGARDESLIIE
ncbi:MAG: flavodoxin reductase [Brumimicrobium sp.]|nr:flavodoxin reductase [Brumimicrobium sp.]MCO5267318.1 FAD-binding oxidoreductase [Brumimicrobium sp.]